MARGPVRSNVRAVPELWLTDADPLVVVTIGHAEWL